MEKEAFVRAEVHSSEGPAQSPRCSLPVYADERSLFHVGEDSRQSIVEQAIEIECRTRRGDERFLLRGWA